MLRNSQRRCAASPGIQIAPETTPVRFTRRMLNVQESQWWSGTSPEHGHSAYAERVWQKTWPVAPDGWVKRAGEPVLHTRYSRAALVEALKLIPQSFETSDVPRPPTRIQAQSEGIVGRWFTNYWTLHSVKFQCQLAGIPWRWGERERPITNYEEPAFYVDFEESKAVRDYRTRWINVHRSMVNMSKRMKDVEDEQRFIDYRRMQDTFWADRRVLINRVKAMRQSKSISQKDLPIATMNLRALD